MSTGWGRTGRRGTPRTAAASTTTSTPSWPALAVSAARWAYDGSGAAVSHSAYVGTKMPGSATRARVPGGIVAGATIRVADSSIPPPAARRTWHPIREVGRDGDLSAGDDELDGRPVGEDEHGVGQSPDVDVLGPSDDDRLESPHGAVPPSRSASSTSTTRAQRRLGRLVVVPLDVPVRRLDAERSRPIAQRIRLVGAADAGPAHGTATTTVGPVLGPAADPRRCPSGPERPTLQITDTRSSTIRQP